MVGADRPGVTPDGVRQGNPDTLQALVALRGPAVLGFCRELCEGEDAVRAAGEAFARFRAAVVDAGDVLPVDPDRLLLAATRHAAAALARPGRAPGGLLRRAPRPTEACRRTAGLLATRPSGLLSPEDHAALDDHLAHCPMCRELEAAFARAEEAYRTPPVREVGPREAAFLGAALVAAAPVVAPPVDPHEVDLADEDLDEVLGAGAAPVADRSAQEPTPVEDLPAQEPVAAQEPVPVEDLPAQEPVAAQEPVPVEDLPAQEPALPDDEALEEQDLAAAEEPVAEDHDEAVDEPVTEAFAPVPSSAAPWDEDGDGAPWDDEDGDGATGEAPAVAGDPPVRSARPSVVTAPRLRPRRPGTGDRDPRAVVLPGVVVAAGVLIALAVAGVFGGDEAEPPQERSNVPVQRLDEPVTTPLPITVATPRTTPATTTPDEADEPGTTTTPDEPSGTEGTGSGAATPTPDPDPDPQPTQDEPDAPTGGLQVDRDGSGTGGAGDAADTPEGFTPADGDTP